jgi:hypothetical protein
VIAFHAAWSMRHRITGNFAIERALASGPVSNRELAQRIADSAREKHDRQSARMRSFEYEHILEVIERPLEDHDFWDAIYDADWFAAEAVK